MLETSLAQSDHGKRNNQEDIQEKIQVCVFELAGRLFGLSILAVQEIMEDAEITPVPTTPHFLLGVINLRGDIVPVVDIREVLNLPIKPRSKETRIMILTIRKALVGIIVDAVTEVLPLEKRIVEADLTQTGIADGKFISNIIQYKEGVLVLLDLNNIYQAIQL